MLALEGHGAHDEVRTAERKAGIELRLKVRLWKYTIPWATQLLVGIYAIIYEEIERGGMIKRGIESLYGNYAPRTH